MGRASFVTTAWRFKKFMNSIKWFVVCALLGTGAVCMPARANTCREVVLYNGKITTMDQRGSGASWITINGDRISGDGTARGIPKHDSCASVVNLDGRRVIPGLMDTHNHIVQLSLRPGHDVRIETAASIADVQEMIRARAKGLPADGWITSIGGWGPEQLVEKRFPTLSELDAAAPNNPVFVETGFNGPAATNSRGKDFFDSHGVKIGPDGQLDANEPTIAALNALRSIQTFEDRKQGALDVMAYAASFGLTTSVDKGGSWPADTPGAKGVAQVGNGAANEVDPFNGYDQFLALDREGKMLTRLRIFFYMQDLHPDLPFLTARLNNQFPDFGDNWIKVSGMGERIVGGTFPVNPNAPSEAYMAAVRLVALRGWAYDQHAQGPEDEKVFADIWEKVNEQTPLAPLRWSLAHVPGIDMDTLNRLKAIGVGVSAAGARYLATTPPRDSPKGIPPFRMLVASGIHVGYGSDGGTVAPLDPWLHMYYMVTGKNSAGVLVAPGQTLNACRRYKCTRRTSLGSRKKRKNWVPSSLANWPI